MSKSRDLAARLAVPALIAGCLSAVTAFAGEVGDGPRKVIRIEVDGGCAGADCAAAAVGRKMVFVGKDGEAREPGGEGLHWIGEGGGRAGFLGVMLTPMTPELRLHQGAPESAGVLVSKVIEGSPAERAGIRVGDVIAAVDGGAVSSPGELARAIRGHGDGDLVTLELWRDGAVRSLTAAVEERSSAGPPGERRIEIRCEGDDCEGIEGEFEPYDCGTPECQVEVRCADAGCDCTVNGDAVDCATIPGPHNRR